MEVPGVTVKKMIEPKILGIHKEETVYLCTGPYGEYLRYDKKNYSIPDWAKKDNLSEMFNLTHAIKIIDYKMKKQLEVKVPEYKPKVNTFQNYKHAFEHESDGDE
jgi:topoisomerase IA-like protein